MALVKHPRIGGVTRTVSASQVESWVEAGWILVDSETDNAGDAGEDNGGDAINQDGGAEPSAGTQEQSQTRAASKKG